MASVNTNQAIDILLVEDNRAHAELIRRALAADGAYQVRVLHDLQTARQAFAEKPPRIALVDMLLPDGRGTSLLPQQREQSEFPIIIMTSHGNEEAAVSAMKSGAFDYVVKTETSLFDMPRIVERALREWEHMQRRLEAETALRASEAKYRRLSDQFQTLLEGIPDVLALIDRDMRLVWANSAARKAVSPGVAFATGRHCYELWQGHDEICPDCPVLRAFATGRTEEQIIERAGSKALWGMKAFPLKNAEGQVDNVIVLATDISEKVQLRAEVARSGQLASLGELAAGVAHEINNPINGIINFGQILLDRYPEGEGHLFAESIIEEGQRIATIVRNLLSFSCQPRGRHLSPIFLQEVVESVLLLTDSQLRRDGIKVDFQIDANLPEVAGQRQQLQQVVLNLISNARYALNQKFAAPNPQKRIEIGMYAVRVGNEARVRLLVTDFGAGIPAHLQSRVFDPFFTTKPHDKGTGLGMSISHGIIKDHGGRIFISSIEQSHTTITIDLPIYQANRET